MFKAAVPKGLLNPVVLKTAFTDDKGSQQSPFGF